MTSKKTQLNKLLQHCARACPIEVLLSRYKQNLYLRTPVRKKDDVSIFLIWLHSFRPVKLQCSFTSLRNMEETSEELPKFFYRCWPFRSWSSKQQN